MTNTNLAKEFKQKYSNDDRFVKISDNIYIHKKSGRVKYNYYTSLSEDEKKIAYTMQSFSYVAPKLTDRLILLYEPTELIDNLLQVYGEKITLKECLQLKNIKKEDLEEDVDMLDCKNIYFFSYEKYGEKIGKLIDDLWKVIHKFNIQ